MKDRMMTVRIMRYDPLCPERQPCMQEYSTSAKDSSSLLAVLQSLREKQDPTLRIDASCRSAVCGSCAMMINGKPGLACKTRISDLPDKTNLHPLPFFKLIGDLSVDTGTWFRKMYDRTGSWVHSREADNYLKTGKRFTNSEMKKVYELDRCIECGCCAAGCATALMSESFISAAGLLRVARFLIDPRDERNDMQWYDVIADGDGIFGCSSYLACNDFCPKGIPLQKTLSMLRRRMVMTGMFGRKVK